MNMETNFRDTLGSAGVSLSLTFPKIYESLPIVNRSRWAQLHRAHHPESENLFLISKSLGSSLATQHHKT